MPNPIELIRTSRLRVPVDADGVPLITTVAASGAVQKTVRSTELYQPVMDDGNGNKIPVFAVLNGGGDDGGDGGVTVHNQLSGRDAADAHPIEAITGLQNALNAKANSNAIPTLTSQLTNDSGFITEADIPAPPVIPTIPNQITKVYVPANAPTGSQVIVTLSQVIGSQTLVLYDAETGNGVTGVTMTGTNPYTLSVTAALPEMWGVQLQ